jgi:hypothetical protein
VSEVPPARRSEEIFAAGGEVGARLGEVDWARTPLGASATWPPSLCSALGTMLRSRFSMWMAWGPQLTFFCNDAVPEVAKAMATKPGQTSLR